MLCWDYAYNVGYRHASSGSPGPLEVAHSSQIPVIADQPDHQDFLMIREGNSPNHGRRGQNVLFGDGSVRWFHSRNIGPLDPDLYLNNDHRAAAGHPCVRLGVDAQQDSVPGPVKPFDESRRARGPHCLGGTAISMMRTRGGACEFDVKPFNLGADRRVLPLPFERFRLPYVSGRVLPWTHFAFRRPLGSALLEVPSLEPSK